MRTCALAVVASVCFFKLGTAFASSVLIEKTDGTAAAMTLPAEACPIGIMKVPPAPSEREFYFFKPEEGLIIRPIRRPGYVTNWEVTLNNADQTSGPRGNMLSGQFWGEEKTKMVDGFLKQLESPLTAKAPKEVYPDKNKSCLGYLNYREQFFGISSDQINRITFYSDDAKANAEFLVFEKNRQAMIAKWQADVLAWRKRLQLGSESHCGMVVDIKGPLVKVQTAIGDKSFKREQLYPAGQKDCVFTNGVYQN